MNTAFILTHLDSIDATIATIRAALEDSLPPPPTPPSPPLVEVANHYGETPMTFEFNVTSDGSFRLQYRAHASDATGNGPQEWTDLQTTGTPNVTFAVSTDRIIEVRAFCEREGVRSEDATLVLLLNDYLPTPPVEE